MTPNFRFSNGAPLLASSEALLKSRPGVTSLTSSSVARLPRAQLRPFGYDERQVQGARGDFISKINETWPL